MEMFFNLILILTIMYYILTLYRYLLSLAQITLRNHYIGYFFCRTTANIFPTITVLVVFLRDNL